MRIKLFLVCLLLLWSFALAENNVEVHFNYPADTVYIGAVNIMEVWLENDIDVIGLSVDFEFSGYTGQIVWDENYGDFPPANLENDFATVWTGVYPSFMGIDDMNLPDTFQFATVNFFEPGVNAAGMRKIATVHFSIPSGETGGSFCIDNIDGPSGALWIISSGYDDYSPDYFGCENSGIGNPDCPAVCFPMAEPDYLCGDANGDGAVDYSDAIFLVNYILGMGPGPSSVLLADASCNGRINIGDVAVLINYFFNGGLNPCYNCP